MIISSNLELIDLICLFVRAVLNFGVEFAVEDDLVPRIILLKASNNIIVMIVLYGTRIHERAILDAVLLKLSLVIFRDVESFQYFVIFEFKTCFHGSVLDKTKNLAIKLWIFNDAAISANLLVLNVGLADIAAILDLDEVDVDDEAADFYHVPDDLIKWHLFQKHNAIICFEVIYFFFDSADQFQIRLAEMQLSVYIQVIRDLAVRVYNQNYSIFRYEFLKINISRMLDKQCKL